jgi:hypothetical protein
MFVAFMSLHILLYGEVLPSFILRVEVFRSLNSNSTQKNLNLYKREFKVNPASPFNPAWVKGKGLTRPNLIRDNGIRLKPAHVKGFALPELNPAHPASPNFLTRSLTGLVTRFPTWIRLAWLNRQKMANPSPSRNPIPLPGQPGP